MSSVSLKALTPLPKRAEYFDTFYSGEWTLFRAVQDMQFCTASPEGHDCNSVVRRKHPNSRFLWNREECSIKKEISAVQSTHSPERMCTLKRDVFRPGSRTNLFHLGSVPIQSHPVLVGTGFGANSAAASRRATEFNNLCCSVDEEARRVSNGGNANESYPSVQETDDMCLPICNGAVKLAMGILINRYIQVLGYMERSNVKTIEILTMLESQGYSNASCLCLGARLLSRPTILHTLACLCDRARDSVPLQVVRFL